MMPPDQSVSMMSSISDENLPNSSNLVVCSAPLLPLASCAQRTTARHDGILTRVLWTAGGEEGHLEQEGVLAPPLYRIGQHLVCGTAGTARDTSARLGGGRHHNACPL